MRRFLWWMLAFCCGHAQAHEFWLVPHDGNAASGEQVVFELRIGPTWPGVQTARLPELFSSFVMRDSAGAQPIEGRDGALSVGHLRVRAPGATVVALRTNPARLELSGTEFEQYLKEEGLNEVLEFRRVNGLQNLRGRERFSRCAKTLVFVDGRSQGYDRVMNLPLELVPASDPLQPKPRNGFAMRLLLNGQPLGGALIKAQLKANPAIELSQTSDSRGMVSFALPSGGLWLFNAVHMESAMDNAADWESTWASMTINFPL